MHIGTARVVCCELAPRIDDPAANREMTAHAIAEAANSGADIIVLPELATSGYVFASADEARASAVEAGAPLFLDWARAAADATVIGGFCELGADGRLYTSAAVVDRGGVREVYRKSHLWGREAEVFAAGDRPPPVVDTRIGRVGVLICYDLEFPEMTRSLARRGADLVTVPANWPLVPRPAGERPPEVIIAMAAARVNRMAIACCDRSGEERGQHWTAGTTIIDVEGWVAAGVGPNGRAVADLDLACARDKSISPNNHALDDIRPELYRHE